MRLIIIGVILLLASAANAATVVLDFEEFTPMTYPSTYPSLQSQGFDLSTEAGFGVHPDGDGGYNSQWLAYCGNCTTTLQSQTGAAFSLESVDLFLPAVSVPADFQITGYYAGGGTIAVDLTLDQNVLSYEFDPAWSNLDQVVFGTASGSLFFHGVDNITVSAVPVPAAAWLFGSALAGLGWIRRKQVS